MPQEDNKPIKTFQESKFFMQESFAALKKISNRIFDDAKDTRAKVGLNIFLLVQIATLELVFNSESILRLIEDLPEEISEEIIEMDQISKLKISLGKSIQLFWEQLEDWEKSIAFDRTQEEEKKKTKEKKIGKKKEMTFLAQILFSIKEKILGPNPSQSNWENSHEFFFSKKSLFFGFFIVFLAGLLLGLSISFWYQRQKEKKKEKEKEKEKVNKEKIGT
ncbi:hypothetical protein CMESO_568 (nucleomorph) [Chroomonas mesostigmatica CCMP1168]|uniref:Uncharacterized protein n=1 Tax=Chroomonas mesostigmatica CCMP1168 TaxID=1195612 RepID=J7G8X2_9CRYP|nr:hypothetical protein CMESO_206 [Chroomonas mesostigmatica CCMP1168]AFP65539.1 hypothetical protein CMESO_374 [Chroomonas mesostigmatica CCMP1168]AFP65552.1 hypothetical protein CMESO_399 [Chroomonas mesostigmatica CCMP1168]AFP65708.1 hypothetical protein CMESO_568 [Chroomonas mesostigmatica CCMP1168]